MVSAALRLSWHATTTLFILSEFWVNARFCIKRGFVLGIYSTVLSVGFAAGPLLFSVLGSDGVTPLRGRRRRVLMATVPIFIARNESPVLEGEAGTAFHALRIPSAQRHRRRLPFSARWKRERAGAVSDLRCAPPLPRRRRLFC